MSNCPFCKMYSKRLQIQKGQRGQRKLISNEHVEAALYMRHIAPEWSQK